MNDKGLPQQPNEPKKEFNAKVQEPKTPSRSRAVGEALQADQVRRMDAKRPRPQPTLNYTPTGPVVQEIQSRDAMKKNADVNKEIAEYRQWIARTKGKTREEFNREQSPKDKQ